MGDGTEGTDEGMPIYSVGRGKVSPLSPAQRFLEKVDRQPFKCWMWTDSVGSHGYGQFRHERSTVTAHRFMFELVFGEIPSGMIVLHSCDVPACVNPMHLRLGTHAENSQDMVKKGRNVSGAKLTVEQAKEICGSELPIKQIAAAYGISDSQVRRIKAGQSWHHR